MDYRDGTKSKRILEGTNIYFHLISLSQIGSPAAIYQNFLQHSCYYSNLAFILVPSFPTVSTEMRLFISCTKVRMGCVMCSL